MAKLIECNIWLTVSHDNPDLEDIAKLQCELEEMRINYKGKVGIPFTPIQWCAFLCNISRFESRMVTNLPRIIMGFPVRLIAPLKE